MNCIMVSTTEKKKLFFISSMDLLDHQNQVTSIVEKKGDTFMKLGTLSVHI